MKGGRKRNNNNKNAEEILEREYASQSNGNEKKNVMLMNQTVTALAHTDSKW